MPGKWALKTLSFCSLTTISPRLVAKVLISSIRLLSSNIFHVDRGYRLLRRLLSLLNEGGIGALHFTYRTLPPGCAFTLKSIRGFVSIFTLSQLRCERDREPYSRL